MDVGGLDLGFGEAELGQEVEARLLDLLRRDFQGAGEEIGAERPFVEDEAQVEGARERGVDLGERRRMKPRARRLAWLMPGAWPSEAWPTA